jgi:hypothetical protein
MMDNQFCDFPRAKYSKQQTLGLPEGMFGL